MEFLRVLSPKHSLLYILLPLLLISCKADDDPPPTPENCAGPDFNALRSFRMGFTTWPYGGTLDAVDSTYAFIGRNADLISEHIDAPIPWSAWIDGTPLPASYVQELESKAERHLPGHAVLLSVSLLNIGRDDLVEGLDGQMPDHTAMDDQHIEDAYFEHLSYLAGVFDPDYFVIAIECNQLYLRSPEKWPAYKNLMVNVRTRLAAAFPDLPISESFTLHDWVVPEPGSPPDYIEEISAYGDNFDFAAISFYPFLEGYSTREEFAIAFNFLYDHVTRPIAFVETAHPTDPVVIPNLNVNIPVEACEQEAYLAFLLSEAQQNNFLFINWWCFADYDALFAFFPPEAQDLGLVWINTGLVNEDGTEKPALARWKSALAQ